MMAMLLGCASEYGACAGDMGDDVAVEVVVSSQAGSDDGARGEVRVFTDAAALEAWWEPVFGDDRLPEVDFVSEQAVVLVSNWDYGDQQGLPTRNPVGDRIDGFSWHDEEENTLLARVRRECPDSTPIGESDLLAEVWVTPIAPVETCEFDVVHLCP